MPHASTLKKTAPGQPKGHSRRRLVLPTWEETLFSSYALGGKGHGITRLIALGLPTPPALVLSTSLARSFKETGELPKRLKSQLDRELQALEQKTGKRFGDPSNPLLVSVRSGAMISMPGMMETVLNVGLTRAVGQTLSAQFGTQFVKNCEGHLVEGLDLEWWGTGLSIEHDAHQQLMRAIKRVLESWNAPRAKAYRREHGIDDKLGTAITIQAMVFGNRAGPSESGTGVAMSHNPESAEPGLYGDYLQNAQGHDLVSGEKTPEALCVFKERQPALTAALEEALKRLQAEIGGPVEVEFTVENGTLYLLQFRAAKLSPEATIIHLVRQKHAKRLTKEDILNRVPESMVSTIETGKRLAVNPRGMIGTNLIGTGDGITRGAAYGYLTFSPEGAEQRRSQGQPYILVRRETTPDDFELMLGAAGIVTLEGGKTCHAAVVARHQGIPAVIGIGAAAFLRLGEIITSLKPITIDPSKGEIWTGELPLTETRHCKEIELFLRWRTQSKPIIEPALCLQKFSTNKALNDFYLAEAMLVDCTDEALAAKIRAVHQQLTTKTGAVFSTYLALAVASEVTYADQTERYNRVVLPSDVQMMYTKLKQQFTLQHRDAWSGLVAPAIVHELAAASSEGVRDFFRVCKEVFTQGTWGGSIGGQAWAQIAAVGEQYWNGDITTTVFVDRVFDLRHNTGTVLNKHEMVNNHPMMRSPLSAQLDMKRQDLQTKQKWEAMLALHNDVNQELTNLYAEGQQKGIWT